MAADALEAIRSADARWHCLEDAAASLPVDAASPAGQGTLAGLIIGVKANIAVAGHPLTAGIAQPDMRPEPADAPIVSALRGAGARIVARLNMDEGAFGAVCENPHFGATDNPAAPGFVTGGSSGGSAAAVAAGAVNAALGSDTLGSVRIPAAYCGVWGLKPGRSVLADRGLFPLVPRFDAPGVLAPDAATLRRVAAVLGLGGAGAILPVSLPLHWPDTDCEAEVLAGLAKAEGAARALGLLADPMAWPALDLERVRRAAFRITVAEAASRLGAVPGISAGLQAALAHGRRVDAAKLADAEAVLSGLAESVPSALGKGDCLLMMPTVPQRAFPRGTAPPPSQALFTAWVNALGWPALAVPVQGPERPVSVQLAGAPSTEPALLAVGEALAAAMA
jgi:aspartyl-tRNA(Asn)/glutamyl-tRNA(Gln) amidotransferase subunit A